MKRLFLLALCIISMTAQLSAKKYFHEEYDVVAGPKVGVNYYNLTSLGGKGGIAPVIGGQGTFYITPKIAIGLEAYWTKGGTKDVNQGSIEYNGIDIGKYDVTMNFININFLLKYYLNPNISIFTGLNEENVLSPKLKTANAGEIDAESDLAKMGISIPFGVSYEFNKKWSVALQYNLGLKKYAGSNEDAKIYLRNAENQQVMLSVGYSFQVM